jgi:hypothetical protein
LVNKLVRSLIHHMIIVFGVTLFLAGCGLSDEALLPSLTGDDLVGDKKVSAASAQSQPVKAQAMPGTGAPPILGTTNFETPRVTDGTPSGTRVGQKIDDLRGDLGLLQGRLSEHNHRLQIYRGATRESTSAYHRLAGAMNSGLQAGATPGSPELVAQWNQSQAGLDKVDDNITSLIALSNESASTSALAAFLLESTRATTELGGAVEEDHRQLAVLEDEVGKTVVVVDRLLDELTDDIARAQNYVTTERSNLTAMRIDLDTGEYIGASLTGRVYGALAPPPVGFCAGSGMADTKLSRDRASTRC